MATGTAHTAKARDGTELYFETHGQRSNPAVLMGPHFYLSRSQEDESFTGLWVERLKRDFFVIVADYPRGIGRTGHPQQLAFSPDIAAEEYERIADAAGVGRFGWVGYSFGGAMGVQVACRSDRVAALAIGGFPPLNAPFQLMVELSSSMARNPPSLPPFIHPGVLWSAVAFYAPLTVWPEQQAVCGLAMPRLVFMGDADAAQGAPRPIPLADNLRAVESELREWGWQIEWLRGHDHVSAMRPEVSLPAVRRFLREALLHS